MGKLSRKRVSQVKDFEPIIAEFLKHWNEKHRNITEKLRKVRKRYVIL